MIDLALLKRDRQWFDELTGKAIEIWSS
ncbi:IDEAL domain-containing protein [Domibacillus antri]